MSESSFLGRIVWWGAPASANKLLPTLEQAGFTVTRLTRRNAEALESSWGAVLFLPNGGNPNWDRLARSVEKGLDKGVNVVVVKPESRAEEDRMKAALRSRLERRGILFENAESTNDPEQTQMLRTLSLGGGELREARFDAVQLLKQLHPPASVLRWDSSMSLVAAGVKKHFRKLLRCSFGDFTSARVDRLAGGRSGAGVFTVIASTGDAGETLLPFVAKVASRAAIIAEVHNFENRVRDFIPFASRPNFLHQRSFVLASLGILIGQFAEGAVPLDAAVRRDGATAALHELFSSVLHRWWANSYRSPTGQATLAGAGLEDWFAPKNNSQKDERLSSHYALAINDLKLPVLPIGGLQARLRAHRQLRWGRIHGDLNCGNVLVREQLPLVIDFSHCKDGPLLADPAWLEVNLVFGWDRLPGGRASGATEAKKAGWLRVVELIYEPSWLRQPLPLHYGEEFDDELHRLCRAVRIIRRHAFAVSTLGGDYAHIVAAALVRYASLQEVGRDKKTRAAAECAAHAYNAASRIAVTL